MRDADALEDAVREIYDEVGGRDVLVRNVGIGARRANPRFLDEPQSWGSRPDGIRDVADTKVHGTFVVARAGGAHARMRRRSRRRHLDEHRDDGPTRPRPLRAHGRRRRGFAGVMAADLADTTVRPNVLVPSGANDTVLIPGDVGPEVHARLLDPAIMGPSIV